MNLQDVKKSYDLIVSLGMSCAPAINLQRTSLRKFSMPLDWMISYSLTEVNKLYKNKFQNFMKLENLTLLEETHYYLKDGLPAFSADNDNTLVKSYFVRDTLYNIVSVHDFPVIPNHHWSASYPPFKEKLDLRIERFWNALINSKKTLFIRWSATHEQVAELHSILSDTLKPNSFSILILNPIDDLTSVQEVNWEMNETCALEVPNDMNDYNSWDYILGGIQLSNH